MDQGLIDGWINPQKLKRTQDLIDLVSAADNPDETAISLIFAAGEVLRTVSDRRIDEAQINQVLGGLMDAHTQGADIGGLDLPLENMARLIYDPDAANRYMRMLMHSLNACVDYTPSGAIAVYQRSDGDNPERTLDAQQIADKAAQRVADHVSPYGLMMLMMLGAFKEASRRGMTPLQIMNAVGKFSEVVLCTSIPIVRRLDEGTEIPGFGTIPDDQIAANLPNIAGTAQFIRWMGWPVHPSHEDAQSGIMPLVGLATHNAVGVPILSVGYSPTDTKGEFSVIAHKANAYEFETRNTDVFLISTKPCAIEHGGFPFSVIGEVFVRKDGESTRTWRPAVAWPGCSIGDILDLARSPLFDMNEVEYSDARGEVLLKLTKALTTANRRRK